MDTPDHSAKGKHLFIDVHQLEPGKVKYEDVAGAHAKDLAVQEKYGVHFLKYWVDEDKGLVYCLSSSSDTASIIKTHAEAHGLLPAHIYEVTDGQEAALTGQKNLFLDVHYLGAGKVSAKDVAAAHKKDLAVQQKYGVNFINYWVNEKEGVVMCLSEAKDSTSIIQTHKEAHGLLPAYVQKVQQGE
jgi:phenolic acid decarboxylase